MRLPRSILASFMLIACLGGAASGLSACASEAAPDPAGAGSPPPVGAGADADASEPAPDAATGVNAAKSTAAAADAADVADSADGATVDSGAPPAPWHLVLGTRRARRSSPPASTRTARSTPRSTTAEVRTR